VYHNLSIFKKSLLDIHILFLGQKLIDELINEIELPFHTLATIECAKTDLGTISKTHSPADMLQTAKSSKTALYGSLIFFVCQPI
jgi:hypothetical protein